MKHIHHSRIARSFTKQPLKEKVMAKRRLLICLSDVRKEEVRLAFKKWYEALPKKLDGLILIGMKSQGNATSFRSGLRSPPPKILAQLWKLTKDERFLFTAAEKKLKIQQGRVKVLPSKDMWPDKGAQKIGSDPPARIEPTGTTVLLSDLLDKRGGETSPLGVDKVLGERSFVTIDLDPSAELVDCIKRQVQSTRAALNLLAQIRDEHTRALVREELGPQVEELGLAIRMFSVEHPNKLTKLHDSQRQIFADTNRGSKKNGGR
jgi:hypothetical protein